MILDDESPLLDALHDPISHEEMDWLATTYFAFEPFLGSGGAEDAPAQTQQLSSEILGLVSDDPERAWPIITELVDRAPDDEVLGWIAASLVEDIVLDHGPQFVERIEQQVLTSPNFHRALGLIYWTFAEPEVERRLRPLADREWSELNAG